MKELDEERLSTISGLKEDALKASKILEETIKDNKEAHDAEILKLAQEKEADVSDLTIKMKQEKLESDMWKQKCEEMI